MNDIALETAFRYLKGVERTEGELRAHLVAKGITPGNVERTVEHCLQKGYVSDIRVAMRAVELAKERAHIGRAKVGEALARRGVHEDEVTTALNEYSDDDELATATAYMKRKLGSDDSPAKAARMLAAKGFSEDTVWAVLEGLFPGFER